MAAKVLLFFDVPCSLLIQNYGNESSDIIDIDSAVLALIDIGTNGATVTAIAQDEAD